MPRDIKKSKIEYLQKNTICNNSIFVFMKKFDKNFEIIMCFDKLLQNNMI